jgi:hypothetical protein
MKPARVKAGGEDPSLLEPEWNEPEIADPDAAIS